MTVVAVIGALTAIFAATIGLVQNDIKKVLAYSTVSPARLHVPRRSASARTRRGIFHLVTHAFFKALLFLGAGSRDPRAGRRAGHAQDGRPRASKMPDHVRDHADRRARRIAGIPPLAGFFSKDEILGRRARTSGHCRCCCASGWSSRALHDRLLHVPPAVPDLLRRVRAWRTRSRTTSTSRRRSMTVPLVVLAVLSRGRRLRARRAVSTAPRSRTSSRRCSPTPTEARARARAASLRARSLGGGRDRGHRPAPGCALRRSAGAGRRASAQPLHGAARAAARTSTTSTRSTTR